MSIKSISRATDFVHSILKQKIHNGDIVVDATMGNGHDIFFLYQQVGNDGIVYGFDIQHESLKNTLQLFKKNNVEVNLTNLNFILDGHENMNKYIDKPIDAAMFNLGYLPGGDKTIVTKPRTTIKALSTALFLLKKGGVISLIIYYGHSGGLDEKNSLIGYINQLPHSQYTVLSCNYTNQKNNPPIVLFVEKK